MIYYDDRIVPTNMRKYIMVKLHGTHIGITKTQKKCKQLFYWPAINKDIEQFIHLNVQRI